MGIGDKLHETADRIQNKFAGSNVNSGKDNSFEEQKPFTSNEVEHEYSKGKKKTGKTAEFVDNVDKKVGHDVGRDTLSGTDKGLGSKALHSKQDQPPERDDVRKDVASDAFMKGEITRGEKYGLNSKGQQTHPTFNQASGLQYVDPQDDMGWEQPFTGSDWKSYSREYNPDHSKAEHLSTPPDKGGNQTENFTYTGIPANLDVNMDETTPRGHTSKDYARTNIGGSSLTDHSKNPEPHSGYEDVRTRTVTGEVQKGKGTSTSI
ncbi:uncharacterized protein RJT21DRAFT_4788 [Scheffersomyces amazonensis]|uniref:uncharacterized protein n=1 Tax=Scheffersomyces amazonensis TaxID=1078765 RepID=UPI00315CEA17